MMETNELTRTLKNLLIPKAALIAYASEDNKNFFLEIRDIDDRGNMAEGRPVTLEFMNGLVKGYSERHSSTPYGKVPSSLIYCDSRKGRERYVWYNPPHKRMMFFSSDLKIENAEYNLPGVIYEAGEHGMRIYAYKDDMPGKDTMLYVAPFFNVTGSSQYRLAKGPDIRKPAAILGKEILADGVFALGRQRKSDPVEPCASNESGQEQTIRPQRVETVEQYET